MTERSLMLNSRQTSVPSHILYCKIICVDTSVILPGNTEEQKWIVSAS